MRALTAVAIAASLLVAGCGSDKKTIPNDEGASLIRLLRAARDTAGDPQKCPQLLDAVQKVQSKVADLPSSVNKNTRDSLVNGVNHLIDDANNECKNTQTTQTTTTPTTTTPTTTTETTPTQTTPTQTTPTQTTPTQTTPTSPTTPTGPGNGGTGTGTGPGNGGTPPGQDKGTKEKGPKKKGHR
jgi:cell division protein FtsN